METNNQNLQEAVNQLKVAHNKIMQAQQKIDNRELNEQMLLGQALDAVNRAQQEINTALQ